MKCVFVAMPYHFNVQYHADALVASHAGTAWVISMDGVEVSYRLHECRDSDGRRDPDCAIFVPSGMGRRDVERMLAAFNAAHPGVIPPHLVSHLERVNWWLRTRRTLTARLDYHRQ